MLQTLNPVPYRFCTLYSGSEGNAAYLETPSAPNAPAGCCFC